MRHPRRLNEGRLPARLLLKYLHQSLPMSEPDNLIDPPMNHQQIPLMREYTLLITEMILDHKPDTSHQPHRHLPYRVKRRYQHQFGAVYL